MIIPTARHRRSARCAAARAPADPQSSPHTHDRVRDIGLRDELLDGVGVLLSLAQQEQRLFQLRTGQGCGLRGARGARACSEQETAVRPPPQRQLRRQPGPLAAEAHRAGAPSRSACCRDAPRSRGNPSRCPHAPASRRVDSVSPTAARAPARRSRARDELGDRTTPGTRDGSARWRSRIRPRG